MKQLMSKICDSVMISGNYIRIGNYKINLKSISLIVMDVCGRNKVHITKNLWWYYEDKKPARIGKGWGM